MGRGVQKRVGRGGDEFGGLERSPAKSRRSDDKEEEGEQDLQKGERERREIGRGVRTPLDRERESEVQAGRKGRRGVRRRESEVEVERLELRDRLGLSFFGYSSSKEGPSILFVSALVRRRVS